MSPPPKIKIAVLINQFSIPAWSYAMLERIVAEGHGEVTLLVRNLSERKSAPVLTRAWKFRKYWMYFLYRWLDQRLFRPRDNAFVRKDIRSLLPDVEVMGVTPVEKRYSDYFPETALETIREHQPDMMIRLGFRILRGDILTTARFGIWSHHHGDNLVNRGGPPGFWECLLRWDRVGSILQVLTEDLDDGRVLFRSWSGTTWYSPSLTNEANYWKTAAFIPRKVKELHERGWDRMIADAEAEFNLPGSSPAPIYRLPGNWRMIRLLLRMSPRFFITAINSILRRNQWYLAYAEGGNEKDRSAFRRLIPPKGRFWADPFLLKTGDTLHLFFEDYSYAERKAHISHMKRDDKGGWSNPVAVLTRPYHLSYPFVFGYNERYYMVPESRQNGRIELYESTSFPGEWQLREVLIDNIQALDPTLVFHDGLWWLFATVREFGKASPNDELFLFSSGNLIGGSWEPHPQNPVISDAGRARPAGRIFKRDGIWMRPSQDCTRQYGYATHLSRITELSRTRYREEIIDTIYPDWDPAVRGTHTYANEDGLTMIDAVRKISRL